MFKLYFFQSLKNNPFRKVYYYFNEFKFLNNVIIFFSIIEFISFRVLLIFFFHSHMLFFFRKIKGRILPIL